MTNHQGLFNGTLNSETDIPHGFGTIRYFKGDRFNRFNYTGQWDNGVIVGGGIIYWNTGARSVQDLYLNCHITFSRFHTLNLDLGHLEIPNSAVHEGLEFLMTQPDVGGLLGFQSLKKVRGRKH